MANTGAGANTANTKPNSAKTERCPLWTTRWIQTPGNSAMLMRLKIALFSEMPGISPEDVETYEQIKPLETSGPGYEKGGKNLDGIIKGDSLYAAAPFVWSNSKIKARAAVIYEERDTPAQSHVIAIIDFGSVHGSNDGGYFSLNWYDEAIMTMSDAGRGPIVIAQTSVAEKETDLLDAIDVFLGLKNDPNGIRHRSEQENPAQQH